MAMMAISMKMVRDMLFICLREFSVSWLIRSKMEISMVSLISCEFKCEISTLSYLWDRSWSCDLGRRLRTKVDCTSVHVLLYNSWFGRSAYAMYRLRRRRLHHINHLQISTSDSYYVSKSYWLVIFLQGHSSGMQEFCLCLQKPWSFQISNVPLRMNSQDRNRSTSIVILHSMWITLGSHVHFEIETRVLRIYHCHFLQVKVCSHRMWAVPYQP